MGCSLVPKHPQHRSWTNGHNTIFLRPDLNDSEAFFELCTRNTLHSLFLSTKYFKIARMKPASEERKQEGNEHLQRAASGCGGRGSGEGCHCLNIRVAWDGRLEVRERKIEVVDALRGAISEQHVADWCVCRCAPGVAVHVA